MNEWKHTIKDLNRWDADVTWSEMLPVFFILLTSGIFLGFILSVIISLF